MTDYDLRNLSNRSFEQLIQALAADVVGNDIVIFGDGPDGGREATFEGKIDFPSRNRAWDGYGVVQAKFRQRTGNVTADGSWAVNAVKAEVNKYLDPQYNYRTPEYYIFVTNVVLTPTNHRGSKDQVIAILEDFKHKKHLKGYSIWDYDQIRVMLDNNQHVRNAYLAWITPGDALAQIINRLNPPLPDFKNILCNFLQKELLSDEYVNLEQAGHDATERIPLAHVFVDLPTVGEDRVVSNYNLPEIIDFDLTDDDKTSRPNGFIRSMLDVSAERLDPKTLKAQSVNTPNETTASPPRGKFVLIGGPGQGKTTVGQFVCQIFRASIISNQPSHTLWDDTKRALDSIRANCTQEDIDLTIVPRFPFRIVLNEFATALADSDQASVVSVFSFLTKQIKKRTDYDVPADVLKHWIANYPTAMIFDGLDEVPSSSNRDRVLGAIRDFWVDISYLNGDVLCLATSRPQGYNDDFSRQNYEHQHLVPLGKPLASHFVNRLADVRYGADADRKTKIISRIERSFESESTARLMRTPLQLTIMTALVDRMGQPPEARWNLFNSYYEVIYQREVERDIPASNILKLFRPDIFAIHNRIGFLLQVESEQSGRSDSRFTKARFISLVSARLKEEGHEGQSVEELTNDIVDAAIERLVFIVGLEADHVGFEIRSLQEFMAAEFLMEGRDEDVRKRLLEIAPLPNWRNVFLFASGKCFEKVQHLRDTIYAICGDLSEPDRGDITTYYPSGPELAIDLLADGLSRNQPGFARRFARIAVRVLDCPHPMLQIRLSQIYEEQLDGIFKEELKSRLNGASGNRHIGAWVCLLQLIANQIEWATELASSHWPEDADDRAEILRHNYGFWRNTWAATEFLKLAPTVSISRMNELFQIGRMSISMRRSSVFRIMEPRVKDELLSDRGKAILNLLGDGEAQFRTAFSFLGKRFDGLTSIQNEMEYSDEIMGFSEEPGHHPSWDVYAAAARFSTNPTAEQLANELSRLAPSLVDDSLRRAPLGHLKVPWPFVACWNMCGTEDQTKEIANKAALGKLGDHVDWLSAEQRWFSSGVTSNDISSMGEERLPFDEHVAKSGFPTTLSIDAVTIAGADGEFYLETLRNLELSDRQQSTRKMVSRLIERYLIHATFFGSDDEFVVPEDFHLSSLVSIFRDVAPVRSIPLQTILKFLDGNPAEVRDFFNDIESLGVAIMAYGFGHEPESTRINLMRETFTKFPNDKSLNRVLAIISEHGRYLDHFEDVLKSQYLTRCFEPLDALIVQMATNPSSLNDGFQLKAMLDVQSESLSNQEPIERIVTTLEHNEHLDRGLEIVLKQLFDVIDPEDYDISGRLVNLVYHATRRRVSTLTTPRRGSEFNFAPGIDLLIENRD